MKFKIDSKDLKNLFLSVSRGVNPKPSIPSLQGIYLSAKKEDEIVLVGSDLDIVIKGKKPLKVEIEGECLVNARVASEVIRKLPTGEVVVSDVGEELRIETKSSSFNLRKLDHEQYPKEIIQEEKLEEVVSFKKEEFFEAVNQVGVAAAQEGSTPVLTGILFDSEGEKTKLVATDSYRLASKDLEGFSIKDLGVVSKKALNEVVRLFEERETEVGVVVKEREVFFDDGVYQVLLRKIEGDYPKYKDLFPKETVFSIETEKEKIMEALDRSSVVAEGYIPVKISFLEKSLKITSVNQDIGGGKEEVPCKFLGVDLKDVEKFEMSFNPTYLMEAINVLTGNKVYFRFSGNQKPLLIQGEKDNYQHLLMPVRSS